MVIFSTLLTQAGVLSFKQVNKFDANMVQHLITAGAGANKPNRKNVSDFSYALFNLLVQCHLAYLIRYCIQWGCPGSCCRALDPEGGWKPLYTASRHGHFLVIDKLIYRGVDLF